MIMKIQNGVRLDETGQMASMLIALTSIERVRLLVGPT